VNPPTPDRARLLGAPLIALQQNSCPSIRRRSQSSRSPIVNSPEMRRCRLLCRNPRIASAMLLIEIPTVGTTMSGTSPRGAMSGPFMNAFAFTTNAFIPVATLRNWEQNRMAMEPATIALMRILAREPEAALRALGRRAA
jgi:hypothetical protein